MKYFDIFHIGPKRKWGDDITLRLATDRGEEQVTLSADAPLENIPESAITEQVRFLSKQKRSRPPVLKLVEVDHEARKKKAEKELKVRLERSEKKATRRKGQLEEPVTEDPKNSKKESKKTKGKDSEKELTLEEIEALEQGIELPKS